MPFSSDVDVNPLNSVFVGFFLDLGGESNCAHDPISKLLIDNSLVSIAIVLNDLIQSVDQRLLGWHLDALSTVGESSQLRRESCFVDTEVRRQLLDIFR